MLIQMSVRILHQKMCPSYFHPVRAELFSTYPHVPIFRMCWSGHGTPDGHHKSAATNNRKNGGRSMPEKHIET